MDPPDGGDVPLLEQLQRMARDAARWRYAAENGFPQCSRQIHPARGPREWHAGERAPGAPTYETPETAIDAAIERDHSATQGVAD
ncbi:hypothetical protein AWB61_02915 [Chromobacterium sp. F49]|nr:hypothetical protein Cv017_01360 [Chromobacterium subtsugae]KZE84946.1 hypothetical protein AWB61_02915 [Chromobacterium sp. F49]